MEKKRCNDLKLENECKCINFLFSSDYEQEVKLV